MQQECVTQARRHARVHGAWRAFLCRLYFSALPFALGGCQPTPPTDANAVVLASTDIPTGGGSVGIPECDRVIRAMASCADKGAEFGLDRQQATLAAQFAVRRTITRLQHINKGVLVDTCKEDTAYSNGVYQCSYLFAASKTPAKELP